MFQTKNNLKKLIAVLVITSMLVCSLFIMPVNAGAYIISEKTLGGGFVARTYGWSSPDVSEFMPTNNVESLTQQELDELTEALQEYFDMIDAFEEEGIEYDKYDEIITGEDFELRQKNLKYGYKINMLTVSDQSLFELTNKGFAMKRGTIMDSIEYSVSNSYGIVIYFKFSGEFDVTTNPAGLTTYQYIRSWISSTYAAAPMSWTNLSTYPLNNAGGASGTLINFNLNPLYTSVSVNFIIGSDANGQISKYESIKYNP